jgi:hypothetical protein
MHRCFRFVSLFPYAAPKHHKRCHKLRGDTPGNVDEHVANRSRTTRDKGLMKFVERRVACDDQNGRQSPSQVPAFLPGAYSAKDQQAQNKIFRQVRAFADDVMK